jgi:hypothetical protein
VGLESADEIHEFVLDSWHTLRDGGSFYILLFVDWSQRVSVEVGPKSQDLFGHYFPREVQEEVWLLDSAERGPFCVFYFSLSHSI